MNIFYTQHSFAKLPYELQNHICTYLPPHPINTIITEVITFINQCGYIISCDNDIIQLFCNNVQNIEFNNASEFEEECKYERYLQYKYDKYHDDLGDYYNEAFENSIKREYEIEKYEDYQNNLHIPDFDDFDDVYEEDDDINVSIIL